MDILTDILDAVRLKSTVYCRSDLNAPWSLSFTAVETVVFHIVEVGHGWLCYRDGDTLELNGGDLVILPQGCTHVITSDRNLPPFVTIHLNDENSSCQRRRYDNGGSSTTLICGTFELEHASLLPVLQGLPPMIHISAQDERAEWLETTIRYLIREAETDRPGSQILLKRLADMLFIQVLRFWLESTEPHTAGWLRGMRDPLLTPVFAVIHQQPDYGWTVARLAAVAAMSRSAFAARFREVVGESPMVYLTRWRMQVAARLLVEQQLPLEEVARRAGYASHAAFSKSFKRIVGKNPGQYRRE
jgi:AraC-like DNA-binding protein